MWTDTTEKKDVWFYLEELVRSDLVGLVGLVCSGWFWL